ARRIDAARSLVALLGPQHALGVAHRAQAVEPAEHEPLADAVPPHAWVGVEGGDLTEGFGEVEVDRLTDPDEPGHSSLVDGDGDVVVVRRVDALGPRPDLGPDLRQLVGGEELLPPLAPRVDEHLRDLRGVGVARRPEVTAAGDL